MHVFQVERACFGAAYVLSLLEAYDLLRPPTASPDGGAGGAEVVFAATLNGLEAWALGALAHRLLARAA